MLYNVYPFTYVCLSCLKRKKKLVESSIDSRTLLIIVCAADLKYQIFNKYVQDKIKHCIQCFSF